jgi:predicted acylesterase/phospholipase RssA
MDRILNLPSKIKKKVSNIFDNPITGETGHIGAYIIPSGFIPEYRKYYDEFEDPLKYSKIKNEGKIDIQGICFGGYGSHGLQYSGVLKALNFKGLLNKLDRIYGSSAGAVTATLLGTICNLPSSVRNTRLDLLSKILISLEFRMFLDKNYVKKVLSLMKSHYTFGKSGPGVAIGRLSKVLGVALQSPIITLLATTGALALAVTPLGIPIGLATSILTGGVGLLMQTEPFDGKLISKGEVFLWWMRNTLHEFLGLSPYDADRENQIQVTFADYFTMTGINLVIDTIDLTTGYVVQFNAEKTPDVEVAQAVLAAIAIPGVFAPVKIMTHSGSKTYMGGELTIDNPRGWTPFDGIDVYDLQGNLRAWDTKVIALLPKSLDQQRNRDNRLYQILNNETHMGSPFWLRTCFFDLFIPEEDVKLYEEPQTYHNRSETDELSDIKGILIDPKDFIVEKYKKDIFLKKTYKQSLDYLIWIHSRMNRFDANFPEMTYLLSSKYREKILIEVTKNLLKKPIDRFRKPSQVGIYDIYANDDRKLLMLDLQNYKDQLKTMYSIPYTTGTGQTIPIRDQLATIRRLIGEINKMTLPATASQKEKSKFDSEKEKKEIQLKALLTNDQLLWYQWILMKYRGIANHLGVPSEFGESGKPI